MRTFQLTEESFKKMEAERIPQEIISKLKSLKNEVYPYENAFIKAIEGEVKDIGDYRLTITECAVKVPLYFTLFINFIITGIISILLLKWLNHLLPLCIRPEAKIPIFAITILFFFHVVWRFLRKPIMASLGSISIKGIVLGIDNFALLLDAIHLWILSDGKLFILNIIFILMGCLSYVYSPFFLRPIDEAIPNIQNFFIKRFSAANAPTISIEPDNMLTVTTIERVWVSPTQVEAEDKMACCEWFSNRGRLEHSGKSCSILYTAPLKKGNDTLTLKMQSPCKTREAYASLYIRIVTP